MSSSPKVLPPGIGPSEHRQFFDELAKVVGDENISRDASTGALVGPHQQQSYGDPYAIANQDQHLPSGAVRPASVQELQQVLRLANELSVPLWTVSRGRNLGYGGSAPAVAGSVVLDLHRMNRIVEVNRRMRMPLSSRECLFLTSMKRSNVVISRSGRLVPPSDGDLSWVTRWTTASVIHPTECTQRRSAVWRLYFLQASFCVLEWVL